MIKMIMAFLFLVLVSCTCPNNCQVSEAKKDTKPTPVKKKHVLMEKLQQGKMTVWELVDEEFPSATYIGFVKDAKHAVYLVFENKINFPITEKTIKPSFVHYIIPHAKKDGTVELASAGGSPGVFKIDATFKVLWVQSGTASPYGKLEFVYKE
jgi:hypothetical protein